MSSHLPQTTPSTSSPALDPAAVAALLAALPEPPGASAEEIASRRASAVGAVAALHPRDPLEAALAARAMAAHYAVMDNFRCAAEPGLPADVKLRYQTRANALSRMMDGTLSLLFKRQAGPALRPVDRPQVAQAVAAAAPSAATKAEAPVVVPPAPAARSVAKPPAAGAAVRGEGMRTEAPRTEAPRMPMTAAQQELLMRELAARTATASPAFAV